MVLFAACGNDDRETAPRGGVRDAADDPRSNVDASTPTADASSPPETSPPAGDTATFDRVVNDGARGDTADIAADLGAMPPPHDASFDAPDSGVRDPLSNGGTITFESIGAAGWYPSRRDPALGPCDAFQSATCCMAKASIASDALTPWDEDLIVSLRGPMDVKQLAVYQPDPSNAGAWSLVSSWDAASPSVPRGLAFDGNNTDKNGFGGTVGSECIVNVSTSDVLRLRTG
jgi:hypothetical protein